MKNKTIKTIATVGVVATVCYVLGRVIGFFIYKFFMDDGSTFVEDDDLDEDEFEEEEFFDEEN